MRQIFRTYVALVIFTLALLLSSPLSCEAQGRHIARSKPNFVIILADDLGYGDLGVYGHPKIKTPHLDRLASQGIMFTEAYAAMPVCSPSRAALLTGRIAQRDRITDWIRENSNVYLPRTTSTIARLLKNAGYRTAISGKWHLSGTLDGTQPTPADHGFDHWFATQNNAAPSHHNPINFLRNGEPVGRLQGNSSTLIVDEAVRWLRSTSGEQPFFLFVSFHAPHEPVATDARYSGMYAQTEQANQAIYYGSITQMDAEIGRLVRAIDDSPAGGNTLIIFTSDNGPETLNRYKGAERSYGSAGELRGKKLELYEGGIRVPLIARWTNYIKRRRRTDEPVSGIDLLPTLVEIANAKFASGQVIDGASFLPALHGKRVVRCQPLYWQYAAARSDPKFAAREGVWKLLAHGEMREYELYNLRTDPGETTNLATKHPQRVRAMAAAMARVYRDVAAAATSNK